MRGHHQANDHHAHAIFLLHVNFLIAWRQLRILTDAREKGFTALE
jgi:hypothetical protein